MSGKWRILSVHRTWSKNKYHQRTRTQRQRQWLKIEMLTKKKCSAYPTVFFPRKLAHSNRLCMWPLPSQWQRSEQHRPPTETCLLSSKYYYYYSFSPPPRFRTHKPKQSPLLRSTSAGPLCLLTPHGQTLNRLYDNPVVPLVIHPVDVPNIDAVLPRTGCRVRSLFTGDKTIREMRGNENELFRVLFFFFWFASCAIACMQVACNNVFFNGNRTTSPHS